MVCQRQKGSVAFWAWSVSIVLHMVVLSVFAILRFSQSDSKSDSQSLPMASVNRVKRFIEASPVVSKPKVKRRVTEQFVSKPKEESSGFMNTVVPRRQYSNETIAASAGTGIVSAGNILPKGVEFFGSFTEQRKICYVVDSSGSMQGIFGRVKKELIESIESLQPDQYFCIIFFQSGRLVEFSQGSLVRATGSAKREAFNFIDDVEPTGGTDAAAAFERALKVRDSAGDGPSTIYFLTDGFELTREDTGRFNMKIDNLLRMFAPKAKINTIGFWPQYSDRKLLEAIASSTGGEFVLITD